MKPTMKENIIFTVLLLFALFTNAPVFSEGIQNCASSEISHSFPKTTDGITSWKFKSNCTLQELDTVLATWATANGYHPHEKKHTNTVLWYQRGKGLTTLPIVVKVEPIVDNIYSLEAFLFAHPVNRGLIFSSYTKINSGGFRGVALRKIARKQVYPLIETLNLTQPD